MLNNIIDRIKLPFRKDKELYLSLYRITGFLPHDIKYYKVALLHRSKSRRNEKGRLVNNERLEFLGDAILDAVVGDIVFRHFPGKREGFLTNTRSKLVQRETLGRLAKEMGISRMILSRDTKNSHNSYIDGNAFEALVGAIYLDRGYGACMQFMEKRILKQLINIDKVAYKEVNFKSKLLEWSQKNRIEMSFKLLEERLDDAGNPVFCNQVVLEGIGAEQGTGYSKKESQQQAAKLTLQRLRKDTNFLDEVFAAKTERTKMEETPTFAVPDTEKQDAQQPAAAAEETPLQGSRRGKAKKAEQPAEPQEESKPSPEPRKKKAKSQLAEPQEEAKPSPEPRRKKAKRQPVEDNAPVEVFRDEPPTPSAAEKKPVDSPTLADNAEFDLSDITMRSKSREEIIAEAEREAYGEQSDPAV